jgi:hypothetical protein
MAGSGGNTQVVIATDQLEGYLDGLETAIASTNTKLDTANTTLSDLQDALTADSATLANVASSATNVTLLASNASRRGVIIQNESTAVLYVKFGATATTSSYTVAIPATVSGIGGYWEMPSPIYTGIIDGIWASANGNARITELA